jgi:hypothetical protein
MSLPPTALFFFLGGGAGKGGSPAGTVGLSSQQRHEVTLTSGSIGGKAGKASPTGAVGSSLQQRHKAMSTSGSIILRSPEDKDRKRRKIQQHGMKGIDETGNTKPPVVDRW